jgi:hypothetical protein
MADANSPVPATRGSRGSGRTPFIVVKPGESLDSIAHDFARHSFRVGGRGEAKAILIHNNQITETTPLRPGQMLNVSDQRCDEQTRSAWLGSSVSVCGHLQGVSPDVVELFQNDAASAPAMSNFADLTESAGWASGIDAITAMGLVDLAGDSVAAAGGKMLETIHKTAQELVKEATAQLGKEVMLSKRAVDLAKVQRFMLASPRYQRLTVALRTLPKELQGRLVNQLGPRGALGLNSPDARWLRRNFTLVEEVGAERYAKTLGASLEGKIGRIGFLGKGTTFAVPAVLGLYNVYKASPTERFKVALTESVGIGLGAAGTELGLIGGGLIVAFLGLTGVGAFLLLFVAAGAASYALSEAGKGIVSSSLGLSAE